MLSNAEIVARLWSECEPIQKLIRTKFEDEFQDMTILKSKRVAAIVSEIQKKAGISKKVCFFVIKYGVRKLGPSPASAMLIQGVYILFFPKESLRWSSDILRAVVAHEMAHVKLGHCDKRSRALSRDQVFKKECLTDLKAAEWVGFESMIRAQKKCIELFAKYPRGSRKQHRKIMRDRTMILDVARYMHKVSGRQKS